MPRTTNAPVAEIEDPTTEVLQGKFNPNVVFDFTKPSEELIPDGMETWNEIKQARSGTTSTGYPKLSIMYQVESDDPRFDGRGVWEDLPLIPATPNSKGTMWRWHQLSEAVGLPLPESMEASQVVQWVREYGESLLGERVRIVWKIQKSTTVDPKSPTGDFYPDRNTVKKFLPASTRSVDDLLG